jgi:epoxyqueuosine reductase
MPIRTSDPVPARSQSLMFDLRSRATAEGFAGVRIASAATDPTLGDRLQKFVALGRHGDMGWMAETAGRRVSPQAMWPEARSAILLAMRYGDGSDPMAMLSERQHAAISCYAQGADYHDIIKPKLKRIAGWLAGAAACDVKVFVDTAPLMEKPLAAKAGLGWQGKHTNLVSRELGSWFFLGAILTTAELTPDDPEADHCGSCTRCLDICPTRAFPAPYQLDARRCISYLTIEHKGHIDRAFRAAMGNRIYGCDDCLAVCPWNKFAAAASEQRLRAPEGAETPRLEDLLGLDDAGFRARFKGSPVKRTGRERFLRNVLIAAGNSGDHGLMPKVEALLSDPSPLVRAMAVWAVSRLGESTEVAGLAKRYAAHEADPAVRSEWGQTPLAKGSDPIGVS